MNSVWIGSKNFVNGREEEKLNLTVKSLKSLGGGVPPMGFTILA